MSEAEILESYWASQEVGVATLALFITAFSAYLLVCYLVGASLTRAQAVFISSAFTIFELVCMWGIAVYFSEGYSSALALEDNHPTITMIRADPTWIFIPLCLASIVGALKFMWDIRRPKPH